MFAIQPEEHARLSNPNIYLPLNYLSLIEQKQYYKHRDKIAEIRKSKILDDTKKTKKVLSDKLVGYINSFIYLKDTKEILQRKEDIDLEELKGLIENKTNAEELAKEIKTASKEEEAIILNYFLFMASDYQRAQLLRRAETRQANNYLFSIDNFNKDIDFLLDNLKLSLVLLRINNLTDNKLTSDDIRTGIENIIYSHTNRALILIDFGFNKENLENLKEKGADYIEPSIVRLSAQHIIHTRVSEYTDKLIADYTDLLDLTLDEAIQKYIDDVIREDKEAQLEALPQQLVNKPTSIDFPIDKVNHEVWKLLEESEKTGQLRINFNMANKHSEQKANVLYSISFDELGEDISKFTKKLTPFDKRVMLSVASLYSAKNEVISVTQIYESMGNTGKPNQTQLKKINESITKMNSAHIFLSNKKGEDAEAKNHNRPEFEYDGKLLPMERMSAKINGQVVESAIHVFREPPLVTFAKKRKQITTITPELLQSPVNKTEQNLCIDDYLIDRISKMKNAKGKKKAVRITKILFDTINTECHRTTSKQKQRTKDVVYTYLDYYKKCDFIKDYTKEADGVNIKL